MAETLAEIVAEGERLLAARNLFPQPSMTHYIEAGTNLARFAVLHGPSLLAVAKAAVEADEAISTSSQHPELTKRGRAALAALRAAVRGADEGGPRG